MTGNATDSRSEVLEGAPLHYAPENELGVVFLFAHLARKWRLRIDAIQSKFPDCIAFQKVQGREKRIRIEFEHRSRNFKTHRHDPAKCDWLVCWEDNWPDAPRSLQIIELRREFGLGFNVWVIPMNDPFKAELAEIEKSKPGWRWSLPSQCHKGDLILYYFTRPEQCIRHIFVAADRSRKVTAGWKEGKDYMGPIQRVCRLKAAIFFEDLSAHRVLSTAHFVRAKMRGRANATEYWPYLYDLIVRRNAEAATSLRRFAPENLR
jgi:hypothetical protein